MPVMLRTKGKAKRIAYKILGVPANVRSNTEIAKNSKLKKRLYLEETRLVR